MPIGKPWWFQQFVCEAALKGADCGLKFEERMQHAWKSWSQVWVCTVCFCVVCAVCSGMAFIYVAVRLVSCTALASAPYWSLYVFWQQFYFSAASELELSYAVCMHEGDGAFRSVEQSGPNQRKLVWLLQWSLVSDEVCQAAPGIWPRSSSAPQPLPCCLLPCYIFPEGHSLSASDW